MNANGNDHLTLALFIGIFAGIALTVGTMLVGIAVNCIIDRYQQGSK